MNLTDFVHADAIIPDLKADSKEAAIREMVASLKSAKHIAAGDEDSIVTAILKREELGSTGIGRGIAVPHTKNPSVSELTATIAISKSGVDFDSLDGEAVHILFLLVSPPDKPGEHLRALETVARQLRDDDFCNFLKQSEDAESIVELLKEADEKSA